jgi:hypothetical protein
MSHEIEPLTTGFKPAETDVEPIFAKGIHVEASTASRFADPEYLSKPPVLGDITEEEIDTAVRNLQYDQKFLP